MKALRVLLVLPTATVVSYMRFSCLLQGKPKLLRTFSTGVSHGLQLEDINSHQLDKAITFNGKNHSYEVNGRRAYFSVTGAVSSFFNPFDADAIIAGMMKKEDWPRPEYVLPDGRTMTSSEIKSRWSGISSAASRLGTEMHEAIESYINTGTIQTMPNPEFEQFLQFYKTYVLGAGISPYRTEWRIASLDGLLAGSVDFVGKKPDGSFVIFDWKRSKKFDDWHLNFGKRCRSPVQHLPDCEATKYSLQVNFYRYLLENVYGMSISEMRVASFHRDLSCMATIIAPSYKAEVDQMIDHLRSKVGRHEL